MLFLVLPALVLPAIGGGLALLGLTWPMPGFGVFILAPALASAVALLVVLLLVSLWSRKPPDNVLHVRASDALIPDQAASASLLPQQRLFLVSDPNRATGGQLATLTNASFRIRRGLYQRTNSLLIRCTFIDFV